MTEVLQLKEFQHTAQSYTAQQTSFQIFTEKDQREWLPIFRAQSSIELNRRESLYRVSLRVRTFQGSLRLMGFCGLILGFFFYRVELGCLYLEVLGLAITVV